MSVDLAAAVFRDCPGGCAIAIRVQPGAKRTAIAGIYREGGKGDQVRLKVVVQAPPVEGRANEAVVAFLAQLFDLPRSSVSIAQGQSSRSKLVILKGIGAADARAALGV